MRNENIIFSLENLSNKNFNNFSKEKGIREYKFSHVKIDGVRKLISSRVLIKCKNSILSQTISVSIAHLIHSKPTVF